MEAARKSHKLENEGLRRELRNFITEQNERLTSCEAKVEEIKEYTKENVDEVKLIASGNTSEMRLLTNKVDILDNKSRQRNLVVDGLPENADMNDKEALVMYVQKVLPEFS